jgi:3-isopropylmalate/(R)-2-methylmalate dehydratase large subunit
MANTLFDKIWSKHVVKHIPDGPDVVYIDRHYIHEVTSPQAFAGLKERNLKVHRPDKTIATADHNVPTENQHLPIQDELSRLQVEKLTSNCAEHGIELFGLNHPYQGIVHVIGPELGITQPGMTIVCGDSHTSTHGAFGAIAFGIGTSEVEMVFASQCVLQSKPENMRINIDGQLKPHVTAKDVILYIISKIGTGAGTGYFIEFTGSVIRAMSMEERMTICNMSIEMGARGGLIAPDETTFKYLHEREHSPKGIAFEEAIEDWKQFYTDEGAVFERLFDYDAADIDPMITYGTNPGMGIPINGTVPQPQGSEYTSGNKALKYMDFKPGQQLLGQSIEYIFIGSCTNGRIEDLREAAAVVAGKKKANHVKAFIVPGSKQVEQQAKDEGLVEILEAAGFQLRQPGCSACLAMNEDKIPAGAYCVSTSNRNFEGRQGIGSRTLLASPATAAATAILGEIADVRDLEKSEVTPFSPSLSPSHEY